MDNGRLRYLESFLDSVDFVEAGKKGAISENRSLISGYEPSFYSVLEPQLKNPDQRVRREVVLLLSALRERKAIDRIKEMRISDNDLVSGACIAYLHAIGDEDDAIPRLIDTMRHTSGPEFNTSAARLRSMARDTDVPAIREIYGQVNDDLKPLVMNILSSIVSRYPELEPKRYLILSEPVYPNEKELVRFLDKSIVYIDIRYRDNYSNDDNIGLEMYNKIASAFRKIQIRLYNEDANLRYYSDDTRRMYRDAKDLLIWAFDDLSSKHVIGISSEKGTGHCPHCGAMMLHTATNWVCPDCGYKQ